MTKHIRESRIERYSLNDNITFTYITPLLGDDNITDFSNYYFDTEKNVRIILITEGIMDITIDYIQYKFGRNTLIEISPISIINGIEISDDLECYDILVSKQFIENTLFDKQPIPISHFLNMVKSPGTSLEEKDAAVLRKSIKNIHYYIKQERHTFRKELLHNSFHTLILELGNIFIDMEKNMEKPYKITRKDTIIREFIRLMDKYGKKEHAPAFYSDKLCISTQYLSLILKEKSGTTAGDWIASYLITQAKIRLRTPGVTLQQISDELHFSDQASFGKFFKKHTGLSPKKYKMVL